MTDPENFSSRIEISRTDEDQRMIWGWLYCARDKNGVDLEDLKRALVAPPVLEEAAYNFVLDHRRMGVMHAKNGDDTVQVGRLIESMCFTAEKWEAMGIERSQWPYECAWWVGFYVDNDRVWDDIKRGEYPDFSISGTAVAEYLED